MRVALCIVSCAVLAGCNGLSIGERDAQAEAIVDEVAIGLAATASATTVSDGQADTNADGATVEVSDDIPEEDAAPQRRRGGLFGLLGGGGNSKPRNRPGTSAADFVGADVAVTPGLASCVTVIGRPDLATDPDGEMSNKEIKDLLECTAERAKR